MPLPYEAFATRHGYATSTCKVCLNEAVQVRKHGLTSLEKELIAAAQNGCAICGRTDPGGKGWVLDHDRACCPGDASCESCRRGVLCIWCNNALGYSHDDPSVLRSMADYLELRTRLDVESETDRLRTPNRIRLIDPTYITDVQNGRRRP